MPKIIDNPKKIIIDHAKNILFTDGYEGLSIRKVAKCCDISVGTIYNYFQTKRDLVTQIIVDYWEKYFKTVEEISISKQSLYGKLKEIYIQLEIFVDLFHDVWMEMHSTAPHFTEKGLKGKKDSIANLISAIEKLIAEELKTKDNSDTLDISPNEISVFIVSNFITMSQMKQFEYESFERIIKRVLR